MVALFRGVIAKCCEGRGSGLLPDHGHPAHGGADLHVQLPGGGGIVVRVSGFLSGFDAKGFTRDGKTHTSNNYSSAARKLDVEVSSAMGGVTVVWK